MKKKVLGIIIGVLVAMPMFVNAAEAKKVSTEEALRQALENGESVELTNDIELSETITITKNDITIDLNGKTLSYESSVAGEAMFTNRGELTITDSTNSADGKILFEYVGTPDTSYGKGNYTISNVGTLIIEKGTVENVTAKMSHACYAVDNNSINSASSLTVNGGTIINTYNYAVRQIAGSNQNSVTINDGTVTGTRAVWVQLAGSDTTVKPNVTLNVGGGKLIGTGESADYKLAVYSYSYGNSLENVKINITGGILEGDLALSGGKNKTISELVNITGGKITDVYSYAETENTRINISGGTFENAPTEYITPTPETSETEIYEVETPEGDTKYVVATEKDLVESTYIKESLTKKEDVEKEINSLDEVIKDIEEEIKEIEASETKDEEQLKALQSTKETFEKLQELVKSKKVLSLHDIVYGNMLGENFVSNSEQSELTKVVKVTLELPEYLEKAKDGYTRKYSVIRLHLNQDGTAEIKELSASEKEGKVTFETDKFSTYILTYEDTLATKNPNTFDGISLYIMIATISLIGLVSLTVYTKKAKNY